ncbi:unnamed protein product [Miscanthus lutarioriparius]|uniref:Uncharacterized protein n=1 Tax=Miscanthus lutarioriparius TaxID=422564 RepID=A0A811P2Y9_9POAL|nr:unnamed protein product [Miscanthus lutarioriparius]
MGCHTKYWCCNCVQPLTKVSECGTTRIVGSCSLQHRSTEGTQPLPEPKRPARPPPDSSAPGGFACCVLPPSLHKVVPSSKATYLAGTPIL